MATSFDALEAGIARCRKCPRLVAWRERVAREKRRAFRTEEYWGKPVPGFGDRRARILAVGLAPGAHGSNRTGRMFTGDASGAFLYPALHRAGLASRAVSASRGDGLCLHDLFLTAVCRCAPPGNRPAAGEIAACLPYLAEEIRLLKRLQVIVALGRIAYDSLCRLVSAEGQLRPPPFGHGVSFRGVFPRERRPVPLCVIASYHPSRQNTQTGRLTGPMFDAVWKRAVRLLCAEA